MSEDRIVEQFKLLKRAKKLEELGNTDRALELYLELHEKYDPNTSDAYERPAIILERKKKYTEALAFCQKAITEIEQEKISGTKEKFEKRIQHINDKLKDSPEPVELITTSYKFGIIGFRSKDKLKMITASVYYLLSIVLGVLLKSPFISLTLIGLIYLFNYFADIFKADKKYKIRITSLLLISLAFVVYSSMQIPDAFNKLLNIEDAEATLEGGESIFNDEDDDKPVITEKHLTDARAIIESEIEVIESVIIVNEGSITLGLLLQPLTNKEKAISLSENFAEILAHQVSKDNAIKAPSFNSLGELYEHYSLLISAGSDGNTLIAKGTKGTSQKYITWRKKD